MLKAGTKAPGFTLPDQNGNDVSLTDFKGKKLILWFFPKANTSGWANEGQGFRDEFQNFQNKNIAIIGVSADSVQRQKNFSDKYNFPFPLLSDENKETIQAYGAWGKKKLCGREYEGIMRQTYIIDENGNISNVYKKVSVKTHAQDVLQEIDWSNCLIWIYHLYVPDGCAICLEWSGCRGFCLSYFGSYSFIRSQIQFPMLALVTLHVLFGWVFVLTSAYPYWFHCLYWFCRLFRS